MSKVFRRNSFAPDQADDMTLVFVLGMVCAALIRRSISKLYDKIKGGLKKTSLLEICFQITLNNTNHRFKYRYDKIIQLAIIQVLKLHER